MHGNFTTEHAAVNGKSANNFLQQTQRQQNHNVTVKLPQMDMPTYNGDRLKWSEFWDTFETPIDKNGSLSEVEKLKYLRVIIYKHQNIPIEAGNDMSQNCLKLCVFLFYVK